MKGRRRQLLERVREKGWDGILITNPLNIRYLTGFTGDLAYLLFVGGEVILYTDFRFYGQAKEEKRI